MTNYYIRTITDEFTGTCQANTGPLIESANNVYRSWQDTSYESPYDDWGIKTKDDQLFEIDYIQKYWVIGDNITFDRSVAPSKVGISSSDINESVNNDGYVYWNNYNERSGADTGYGADWWTSRGWTHPETGSYTTFVNEICAGFDANLPESSPTFNLIIFKIKWADVPNTGTEEYSYRPVFYLGNDPNKDRIYEVV